MSNVFRSENTIPQQGNKKIAIRNLFSPQDLPEEKISMTVIYEERDRLLQEAKIAIEQEQAELEQMRHIATEDVRALRDAWQQEKATLERQAYEEGFQIGYEEGRGKIMADLAETIQRVNDATNTSNHNAEAYLESQERVILDLAIRSAERIIGQSLKQEEATYLSIVKQALKEAREMKEIKLYVSLDYFELVSKNRSELAAIFPPDIPFLIFANDDFESTQCYIETNHGRIVVSIDEQLNELREKLVEILESGDSR
ncbi:flagellar assembly protein FliH [Sporosarcina sp. HYO08]|uniref:flagellar assembly protein FliH n=1 Tax=Sporosarcina sp. HYO08 TaxID=1759557 RepID=UPI000795599C|nr:flagellar assembly protein FliH [Sporosarcina sp. HYO08]KXH79980.1 flagellar assembly protein FliH [Sporosarcina sp. HYO08]